MQGILIYIKSSRQDPRYPSQFGSPERPLRLANLNGNYAISDKPLTGEEWAERYVKD
jgi:hypothetical protein